MRSESEAIRAMDNYADTIKRICFCHLKSKEDTEDVFQNVFLKYLLYKGTFETMEHEKAWFIRVTINACTDHLRALLRRKTVPLETVREEAISEPEHQQVLAALLSLPEKYRDALYLHYYEGYSALEIGALLHKKENTVYSLLSRGRLLMKEELGGEDVE